VAIAFAVLGLLVALGLLGRRPASEPVTACATPAVEGECGG
jgi:hypothetical protein